MVADVRQLHARSGVGGDGDPSRGRSYSLW